MTAITAAETVKYIYSPEINDVNSEKRNLPEFSTDPEIVNKVTKNNELQNTEIKDEHIGAEIRSRVGSIMPSLLSEHDEKWLKLAIELCKVLNDDALNQQERQNKLDSVVIELAKQLKDMKYKEAEIQVKAAITGALISVGIAVLGAALSIKGIDAANPAAPTPCGITGQAISGLTQPISQVFVQLIQREATELQGDAEVIRAQKDLRLKSASTHGKASDEINELKKKLMDMAGRHLESKQATAGNLLSNMRT